MQVSRVSRLVSLFVLLLLVARADVGWALNANEWLDASEETREFYMVGIIDMWMGMYVSWDAEKKRKQDFSLNETDQQYYDVVACILDRKWAYSDVIEAVELHARMSIEKRDASMSYLALEAVHNKCGLAVK